AQWQLPPFGIECADASPAHLRSHVALEQLTEHDPVHRMWHVELPLHEALPLAPRVSAQVEFPVQSRLQELPQLPAQSVWLLQDTEQLPASAPQIAGVMSQLVPELQVHVDPLQLGALADESELQAATTTRATLRKRSIHLAVRVRMVALRLPPRCTVRASRNT